MLMDYSKLTGVEPNIPCYIYDKAQFINNVSRLRALFENNIKLLFSVKANPFLIEVALNNTDGIEICSAGELFHAVRCNTDPEKITFGGVCKEETDFEDAINYGIRRFSIESLSQLQLLEKVAVKYRIRIAVILRISAGNQFGMSINDIKSSLKEPLISASIVGVHYYPTTMRLTESDVNNDFAKFRSVLDELSEFNITEIEYGGGIGIDYYGDSDHWVVAKILASNLKTMANKYRIIYEAGRILAADAGFYITRVVDIKEIKEQNFVIVNGGRHHFTYHGGVTKLSKKKPPCISIIQNHQTNETAKYTIVGALCNAGDILAVDVEIPLVAEGDYIVFHNAGAYCVTEGTTLFLSRDIPAIFFTRNDILEILRPRNKTEWLKTFYGEKNMREVYDALLEQYTGRLRSEITDALSFRDDLNMDSLSIAMLYPEIEDTFKISFSPLNDDLGGIFRTVGSLWEFVKLRGSLK
jgi:diaminopimelate decarboxylase